MTYPSLRRIAGGSDDDDFDRVEAMISSASVCAGCITAKTGIPARNVEIALKVLSRTSSLVVAGACDSCGGAQPSFSVSS